MKILQVNCGYNKGSTGKIVADVHAALIERGFTSLVCYGRGQKSSDPAVIKTCGELYSKLQQAKTRLSGVMYGGCRRSTRKLTSIIQREKPDVVHLHCINGYFVNIYRLVTWLKEHHIKTVLTLHAEFMHTANCGHAFDCEKWKTGCGSCPRLRTETKSLFFDGTHRSWKRMARAFHGFDEDLLVTSVSPWLMERAKQSPILGDKKHTVVLNGLEPSIFHLRDTAALRARYAMNGEAILFHATPNFNLNPNHIKGGYYINELAKRFAGQNIKIIVAGPYSEVIEVAENVILLGRVSDQELLAAYYSMADITLLASKRETFSMVTAESLASGTPVVGFAAGGPEQIALPAHSTFVPYGDLDALESAVRARLADLPPKKTVSEEALRVYAKSVMAEGYLNAYTTILNSTQQEESPCKKNV